MNFLKIRGRAYVPLCVNFFFETLFQFLPAATTRWSINAVSSSPSPPSSYAHKIIEHGSIETNELNMTLMRHMTYHDSV